MTFFKENTCKSCNKKLIAGAFPTWVCLNDKCKNYLEKINIKVMDNTNKNTKLPKQTYTREEVIKLFDKYQGDRIEEELRIISKEIDIFNVFTINEWLEKNL